MIRNGSKWLKGQIVAIRGPLSYTVSLQDGRQVRRHVDHVQRYYELDDLPSPVPDPPTEPPVPAVPTAESEPPTSTASSAVATDSAPSTDPPQSLRRSTRDRRPPDRFVPS